MTKGTQTSLPTKDFFTLNHLSDLYIAFVPSEKAFGTTRDVFPDREGLILRQVDDEPQLTKARWDSLQEY